MKKGRVFWTPTRTTITAVLITAIATIAGFIYLEGADMPLFFPSGDVGVQQRDIMVFTMLLSLVVIIPVYTMLVVFSTRYRANRKHKNKAQYTPDDDHNNLLEAIWWGIPILLIIILGTLAWKTTHSLDPHKPLDSKVAPLRVQVVTLQWRWLFIYPDQHIASLNQLKIPAGTPVNFEITADAPMSAFWIPALGTQIYAMEGMNSKLSLIADKPGMYRGTNTNINGRGYSSMDFDVVAMNGRADFDSWAKSVYDNSKYGQLDFEAYGKIAEPNESNEIKYYTLKDLNLFNRILNVYMNHDSTAVDGVGDRNTTNPKSGKE